MLAQAESAAGSSAAIQSETEGQQLHLQQANHQGAQQPLVCPESCSLHDTVGCVFVDEDGEHAHPAMLEPFCLLSLWLKSLLPDLHAVCSCSECHHVPAQSS